MVHLDVFFVKKDDETSNHVFLGCVYSQEVWRQVSGNIHSKIKWTKHVTKHEQLAEMLQG